jgi:hypothetical protein
VEDLAEAGAITQRMPKRIRAQTAPSRDDPQPKLDPASRILPLPVARLVEDEVRHLGAVERVSSVGKQLGAEVDRPRQHEHGGACHRSDPIVFLVWDYFRILQSV